MAINAEKARIIREIVESVLGKHSRIIIFGSQARGDFGFGSDIDVGVYLDGSPLPAGALSELKESFDGSSLVERVDIVDMGRVSSKFRSVVEKDAIVL